MTLRLRLVLALAALVTVGLGVFGFTTYSLYSRNQYAELDQKLRAARPVVEGQLLFGSPDPTAGRPGVSPQPGARPGPPAVGVLDTYAELRDRSGATVKTKTLLSSTSTPDLPESLTPAPGGRLLTTGSTDGSTEWRVLVDASERDPGSMVVVATPLSDVHAALRQLILIELGAALGLLVLLTSGSWAILRRGLLPLEHMATSARTITAGDLSQRVAPAGGTSEVGQLGLALNTMLDEIEEAFREREATELRLRRFLADASHELRTPLTSIQGFAELFRLGAAQDSDHVDSAVMMRRIEEESARMKVLVEDLLLLARLDQTRAAERAAVDLAVLAADACSDAVAVAPDRAVTLTAPEPVVVLGDRDHLRQALANLVTNALRHTPEGTAVDVVARLEHGRAEVVVRDHGPGLDDEALAHAFDRFWQADAARVGTGAGLGLSIVAAIADAHGGHASVRNHPDGGAEFTLRLPLSPDPTR